MEERRDEIRDHRLATMFDPDAAGRALARALSDAERGVREYAERIAATEKNPFGENRKARRRLAAERRRDQRRARR